MTRRNRSIAVAALAGTVLLVLGVTPWAGKRISGLRARCLVAKLRVLASQRPAPPTDEDGVLEDESALLEHSTLVREVLGEIVDLGEAAVPPLAKALRDTDDWMRYYVVRTLIEMLPSASNAEHVLAQALEDREAMVRCEAARALVLKGGPQIGARAMSVLVRDLDDGDWQVRYHALVGLHGVGTRAEPAIPKLQALIDDDNEFVRCWARSALKVISGTVSGEGDVDEE